MENAEVGQSWSSGRMEYQPVFITAAANTVAQAVVWFSISNKEFVAYSASNSVALVDVRRKRVLCTLQLQEEEERVTSVCYAPSPVEGEVCLFAGGGKGHVGKWRLSLNNVGELEHSLVFCLPNEGRAISSMHALCVQDYVMLVVADTSGSVRLLRNSDLRQSLKLPPAQLPNSVHMAHLTSSSLLLALGCVDARIHLYVVNDLLTPVGQLSGHEEWITCITTIRSPEAQHSSDMAEFPLLLASGSQDNKIRIWRVTSAPLPAGSSGADKPGSMQTGTASLPRDALITGMGSQALAANPNSGINLQQQQEDDDEEEEDVEEEDEEGGGSDGAGMNKLAREEDRNARLAFPSGTHTHCVHLDALLVGHEDWVSALHWMPGQWPPVLFSASMDRNLVLWREQEVWSPSVRVGDLGGALGGSIGGNLLGFVSAAPAPTASPPRFLAIGYGGAAHLWSRISPDDADERWGTEAGLWSGHFGAVQDLAWQDRGDFLVSVSLDQTCRLYAADRTQRWTEVSRPQIHGHDLQCLALGPLGVHVWTGGEEKLIRVFEMPHGVRQGLQTLCNVDVSAARPARVDQAYIPELGLSNKGRENMTSQEKQEQEQRGVQCIDWKAPPLESQLADFTLWLETQKLFGHNNSVLALTVSADRKYMASSSKARYGAQCVLMLWQQRAAPSCPGSSSTHPSSVQVGEDLVYESAGLLPGHESTVVCLAFSPCSQRLATAGKDRRLCVYARCGDRFEHVVVAGNAHKRIIWDLSWCSREDTRYSLVTASRDGTCKLWTLSAEHMLDCLLTFSPFDGLAVTAVDVLPHAGQSWLVAVGAESGALQVWEVRADTAEARRRGAVPPPFAHSRTVRRIRWRPGHLDIAAGAEMATCSEDHSVRIHRVQLV